MGEIKLNAVAFITAITIFLVLLYVKHKYNFKCFTSMFYKKHEHFFNYSITSLYNILLKYKILTSFLAKYNKIEQKSYFKWSK